MPLLHIKNLSHYLAQSCIIDHFNLSIDRGEILTLFGPSGCGKTTLLKLISNILKLQDGAICFMGKISYLFQEHRLFDSVSVYENIALVMKNVNKQWIIETLNSVGLSEKDSKKYPHELSGGMRARVAFVRAIAYECDLLLLDEPFSGLDFKMRKILMCKLKELMHDRNIAIILVTHDAYEACMLSHKILFLSPKKMYIEKELKISEEIRDEQFLQKLLHEDFKERIYFD